MSNKIPIVDYDFVAERFKRILKARRKSKGMTQEQIAGALNVNIKTYRSWEKGALPNALDLFNLSNLLDCDVDYLLGRMTENCHFEKFIHEYFSLSPEAFDRLLYLNSRKTAEKDSEYKKMANELSIILEYLINTEEGGFMLDQIRQYVFGEGVTVPTRLVTYNSLMHGRQRYSSEKNDRKWINWIAFQDIMDSLLKMKKYIESYVAQKNAARFLPVKKNEDNKQ